MDLPENMALNEKSIVITGGSRGLGLGLVEACLRQGARVTVMARPSQALDALQNRRGVAIRPGDVTDRTAMRRVLAEAQPDIVILNAGTPPPMAPIDSISWEDFNATWDTDVRASLYGLQAALDLPLKAGSRVLMTSSGAAIGGSPMSGGYGGAKRMIWFMARYANALAEQKAMNIRFQTVVLRQMVGNTGTGDAGSTAYARMAGITPEDFLARFGTPLSPADYGHMVVELLTNPRYSGGDAFGLAKDTGITELEGPGV